MASGKYSRIDGRKSSSSYCSTVTIVVFLSLCLVGVWMMASPSIAPVQTVGVSSQENKNEVKEHLGESNEKNPSDDNNESNSKEFEDSPGDLPEYATRGDINTGVMQVESSSSEENSHSFGERHENATEGNQEEKPKNNHEKENEKENRKWKTEDGNSKNDRDSKLKSDSGESESNQEGNSTETKDGDRIEGQVEEKLKQNEVEEPGQSSERRTKDMTHSEDFRVGAQSELFNETAAQSGAWSTQAIESKNEKELQKSSESNQQAVYSWKLCNVTAGPDYIPCLDNLQAIRRLRTTKHYEHRERHCPEDPPTCLVPLPEGYQRPVQWPSSREKIWYHNVPHTELVDYKGHQNWVKVSGNYLTFPGGGTQFQHGALHYIDFIQQSVADIAWGKRSRVVLDVGCGVASFGGYLFDREVVTVSFAPKDEHEAQVQFALERGIPAISAVMGTMRLPFPGRVFDVVHCARCRVPWHIEGGKLLLELNRVLRPGGYFVWSATPVYQKLPEDVEIWEGMCRCKACMHKVPVGASDRGSQWPEKWPVRLDRAPYWLLSSQVGVYGKAAPVDFTADYENWKHVVTKSYLNGMGINWSTVRNVMDMKAIYGGFAAALKELKLWVMNVVPIDSPDTLPIIYERGLFGIYHDWCESFSTYPRSYDLLHADHLFSKIKKKCSLVALIAEVDRILRPEGNLIIRDNVETINELESLLKAMHWDIRLTYFRNREGFLCIQKTMWRPSEVETLTFAVA